MAEKQKLLNNYINASLGYRSERPVYPASLFKYRQANQRNITTLKNGKAWFQSPKGWEDKHDCRVLFDEDFCINELVRRLPELRTTFVKRVLGRNQFRYMLEKQGGKENWNIACSIIDNSVNKKGIITPNLLCSQLTRHFGIGQAHAMATDVIKVADKVLSSKEVKPIKQDLRKLIQAIAIRDRYVFLCLTERYDNDKMWNEYAKGGFCIEYDVTRLPRNENGLADLLPVVYGPKDPFDLIEFLKNLCLCFNKAQEKACYEHWTRRLFVELMRKELEFSEEEEWRIPLPGLEGREADFDYAVSLYIDENIDSGALSDLLIIAEEKDLNVYFREKSPDMPNGYVYELKRKSNRN